MRLRLRLRLRWRTCNSVSISASTSVSALTLASTYLQLSILLLLLRTLRGFSSVGPVKQQIFDLLSFTRIPENRPAIFGTRACDWQSQGREFDSPNLHKSHPCGGFQVKRKLDKGKTYEPGILFIYPTFKFCYFITAYNKQFTFFPILQSKL